MAQGINSKDATSGKQGPHFEPVQAHHGQVGSGESQDCDLSGDGSGLLEGINSPADLKRLNVTQLKALAGEIRQFILDTVSSTGGHLASNLGVVEATLALHYVFDFARDRLVWDVGHQCYAHKIITGRKEQFKRLRKAGGLSGFPNPAESEYDHFAVGHAGTSIGTAIGLAMGAAQRKSDDKIVALIGDASIVNGASFESLNNLGLVKRQMLIVLNDNSMAIDPTQGAVAKYFSRIRLSQTYDDLRRTTNEILEHLPFIGKTVEEALERIKRTIRMALPASQLFESLHIPYFGPVDGHDIGSLIQLFEAMKKLDHPAILHCYTKKGMGFTPASSVPSKYHSTGPFEVNGDSCEQISPPQAGKQRSFTAVFGEQLAELAEKDDKVVAITSAMCDGTGLVKFRERFPERFYDVGIAESAAVEMAAGLAGAGLKPVVCIYSTFLQRSFDQIFQEVSLQNLPVVFCIDRAGLVGPDGPTHHGLMDIGYLRMMPNLVLVSPADTAEMKGALQFALSAGRAVCIRYPKDFTPSEQLCPASSEPFVLGRGISVRKDDEAKVAIAAYGSIVSEAIAAAEQLGREGIKVEVVNARFAAPIDLRLIEYVESGKMLLTVEDHGSACGFGSAVLEAAGTRTGGIAGKVRVLGAPRRFIRHDLRQGQLMEAGINADAIAMAVRQLSGLS